MLVYLVLGDLVMAVDAEHICASRGRGSIGSSANFSIGLIDEALFMLFFY